MNIIALIPAYNPSGELIALVRELSDSQFCAIVVVNDGSLPDSDPVFAEIGQFSKVTILRHGINLGKGAALKTGLNHAYCYFPSLTGVVTLDADGQHTAQDALSVAHTLANNPGKLVIGARGFDNNVPLRSKVGNSATSFLFRILMGQKLTDTQSGLRGIPTGFIPRLLKINSNGYEFELDMLLASKYSGQQIIETGIETVYIEGNKSSHFNPLLDSMKIYFVLFRFILSSALTAIIDYSVFFLVFAFTGSLISSQISARLTAMIFNYSAVRKLVFYSEQKHSQTFPRYAALVLASGTISYLMINALLAYTSLNVISAKVISELMIFLANFAIQRDFIFTRNRKQTSTDWDRYYSKPYKTATFTRKVTEGVLHSLISRYKPDAVTALALGELGGANSCFYDGIKRRFNPARYYVIDNNKLGLERFKGRVNSDSSVVLVDEDVLTLGPDPILDLVFSVGLIEHFGVDGTQKAIAAHFKLLKPQGIAIISFPTPTFLYLATRFLAETLGLWIFHDERPLHKSEVKPVLDTFGVVVYDKIIWSIFLTQRIMVVRSN
jgi:putative flippase GtrA